MATGELLRGGAGGAWGRPRCPPTRRRRLCPSAPSLRDSIAAIAPELVVIVFNLGVRRMALAVRERRRRWGTGEEASVASGERGGVDGRRRERRRRWQGDPVAAVGAGDVRRVLRLSATPASPTLPPLRHGHRRARRLPARPRTCPPLPAAVVHEEEGGWPVVSVRGEGGGGGQWRTRAEREEAERRFARPSRFPCATAAATRT